MELGNVKVFVTFDCDSYIEAFQDNVKPLASILQVD